MNAQMPFCTECGTVGTILSGVHPDADGIVRWTLYRCGHLRSEVVLDEVLAADAHDLSPATLVID